MKFWQNLSWIEIGQQIELARFAEELGFDGVMHGDHFCFPDVVRSRYPLSDDGKPPMPTDWDYPDVWVTMAAQAAVTSRLRLSVGIYVMPTRHPLVTAKATGTLALISGNRAIIGVAPGWMREEFEAAGIPFGRRGERLDEAITATRAAWQGGVIEHHGEFYDFGPIRMEPMPGYELPVFIGGSDDRAMRRAARLGDGWLGAGNAPEDVPGLVARLRRMREEEGRLHLPFEHVFPLVRPVSVDELKRLDEHGMDVAVSWPFVMTIGPGSSIDDKKRSMEAFAREFLRAFD